MVEYLTYKTSYPIESKEEKEELEADIKRYLFYGSPAPRGVYDIHYYSSSNDNADLESLKERFKRDKI